MNNLSVRRRVFTDKIHSVRQRLTGIAEVLKKNALRGVLDDLRSFSRKRLRPSFSILVSGTVLRLRLPSEPYRDAFAASDAEVNET